MKILGISAYYHDSAAALIEDGKIIAAAQEERFTRLKNDSKFPEKAVRFCLTQAHLKLSDLDAIVFYDKPFLKFERLLDTYFDNAPKGLISFITAMPIWLKEKLFLKSTLKKELKEIDTQIDWNKTELLFSKHHLSHAASAFFATNFDNAAILTIDGVGEWATTSIALGNKNNITTLVEQDYPDSVGLLYSAFTYFLGFEVNSGEYKVMGLAPYVEPEDELVQHFINKITSKIVTLFEDGSIQLNKHYFKYSTSLKMIDEKKFEKLFGLKTRKKTENLNFQYCALAQALQQVLEKIMLTLAHKAKELTQSDTLCMAGGVALNCVANGRIKESGLFENVYIQPAAGDAGGALGAALAVYYLYFKKERIYSNGFDLMQNSKLGPSYSNLEIKRAINAAKLNYIQLNDNQIITKTKELINKGKIIGWFQGRAEFGPRALGSRSILANPLLNNTQSDLNLKIKKRESFRPFAPIMLESEFEKFYGQKYSSPYMLFVHKIKPEYRYDLEPEKELDLIKTINQKRSILPAITHIDYTSRIQTVNQTNDKKLFDLLNEFKKLTDYGVLVNTSFNVNDEPIVCSPEDAINCFLKTEIDYLVLENYLITK